MVKIQNIQLEFNIHGIRMALLKDTNNMYLKCLKVIGQNGLE